MIREVKYDHLIIIDKNEKKSRKQLLKYLAEEAMPKKTNKAMKGLKCNRAFHY